MVTAITHQIRISVESRYQSEFSDPVNEKFLYSYSILIQNLGSETVQLMSRYWEIKNAFGFQRIVEGEGVVGEQPIIAPGRSHIYTSACDMDTYFGSMQGHYIFERLSDGTEVLAEIPEFILQVPFILS